MFLSTNKFGVLLVLFFAPLLITPAHFGKSSSKGSLYRRLGFVVPATPGWMLATAVIHFMHMSIDKGYIPTAGFTQGELSHFERILPTVSYLEVGTLVFLAVYLVSFAGWTLHQAICWALNKRGLNVHNAKFQFYLVRNSGFAAWFSIAAWAITLFIANIDFLTGKTKELEDFSREHSLIFLSLVLLVVTISSVGRKKVESNMVLIYGSQKLYNIFIAASIFMSLLVLAALYFFIKHLSVSIIQQT